MTNGMKTLHLGFTFDPSTLATARLSGHGNFSDLLSSAESFDVSRAPRRSKVTGSIAVASTIDFGGKRSDRFGRSKPNGIHFLPSMFRPGRSCHLLQAHQRTQKEPAEHAGSEPVHADIIEKGEHPVS